MNVLVLYKNEHHDSFLDLFVDFREEEEESQPKKKKKKKEKEVY